MTLPTKARSLNVAQLLLEVHEAQDVLTALDPKLVPDDERNELRKAIDTAISVIVIYIKLGREPKVSAKHWEGVDHFRAVLAKHAATC